MIGVDNFVWKFVWGSRAEAGLLLFAERINDFSVVCLQRELVVVTLLEYRFE